MIAAQRIWYESWVIIITYSLSRRRLPYRSFFLRFLARALLTIKDHFVILIWSKFIRTWIFHLSRGLWWRAPILPNTRDQQSLHNKIRQRNMFKYIEQVFHATTYMSRYATILFLHSLYYLKYTKLKISP